MLLTKDFFGLLWILLFSSLQRLQGKEVFTDHRVYAVCSSDLFAALFRHLSPYFCPYGLTLIQTDHTSALFPDFVIRLNWPVIIFILYIKFYSEFILVHSFSGFTELDSACCRKRHYHMRQPCILTSAILLR